MLFDLLTMLAAVQPKQVEFEFLVDDDRVSLPYHFEYDDAVFAVPTNKADLRLMRFSLYLAMAASTKKHIIDVYDQIGFSYTAKNNYKLEEKNILAGDTITDSVYYPAQTIDGTDYINSIAYAIASKKIEDETVVLATVRGGNYGIEWGGNFLMGDGTLHEGFKIAAEQVLEGLKNYVKEIDGKVRVHLSGYSRGAAVCNIVAAQIDKGAIDGLNKDNTSCYTFECPRTTKESGALGREYDNIINLVNPGDVVPKIAFSAWGYVRYGTSLHLPTYQSDRSFEEKFEKMKQSLEKLDPKALEPSTDDLYTVDKFASDLAFILGSPEEYVKKYQKQFISFFMNFEKSKQNFTKEQQLGLKALEQKIYLLDPVNAERIKPLLLDDGKFQLSFAAPLFRNHQMVTELAWLESLDSLADLGPDNYQVAYFTNVTDLDVDSDYVSHVIILDGQNQEIAEEFWNDITLAGQRVVILSTDRQYKVWFTGKDTMGYSVDLYDMVLGNFVSGIDFGQLKPPKGGRYSGNIHRQIDRCSLSADRRLLRASKIYMRDLPVYKVIPEVQGKAEIIGGGYFVPAQLVLVEAKDIQGSLDGFFIEGKRMTKSSRFLFYPDRNVRILVKID